MLNPYQDLTKTNKGVALQVSTTLQLDPDTDTAFMFLLENLESAAPHDDFHSIFDYTVKSSPTLSNPIDERKLYAAYEAYYSILSAKKALAESITTGNAQSIKKALEDFEDFASTIPPTQNQEELTHTQTTQLNSYLALLDQYALMYDEELALTKALLDPTHTHTHHDEANPTT